MARVLFVDDDSVSLETLSRATEILGHEPVTAITGEQALTLANSQSFDLIFSDIQLQDIDGFQLLQRLRETDNCNDVPIFILSASPAIDAVKHSLEAGATAYLAKPLRLDTLEEIIEEYCKA